jgi:hypothetical protein
MIERRDNEVVIDVGNLEVRIIYGRATGRAERWKNNL